VTSGRFTMTEPVKTFDNDTKLKSLERTGKNEDSHR